MEVERRDEGRGGQETRGEEPWKDGDRMHIFPCYETLCGGGMDKTMDGGTSIPQLFAMRSTGSLVVVVVDAPTYKSSLDQRQRQRARAGAGVKRAGAVAAFCFEVEETMDLKHFDSEGA
ncbi:hypothetical protein AXG93_2415s1140 [Marchantia polymorpha subsp. ruderalis]|uniref:Uncharacterized protein n=1 Tax=Marchantia polymorpha subsp. ruderalis TaxID=1480154 RepID=A0A176VWK9_MARPO|nr:hypothetical protein AXG93_2415s1140 [Marchantia polymorpha subsp. ruderalis]